LNIVQTDYNNDGHLDILVLRGGWETAQRKSLLRNNGNGTFTDVTFASGLATVLTGTQAAVWTDYDNDGWLDLFVANGAVNTIASQRGQSRPLRMRNQLFHNVGGHFEETSGAAGPPFATLEVGRGAAFGDIDNDGDIDIVVTTNGGPVQLLLNQSESQNHWVQLKLVGRAGNRRAHGALVGLERRGMPTQWRRVHSDGSYLSASDDRVHFGIGASTKVDAVGVQWPDGNKERWTSVAVDKETELRQGTGTK